MFQKTTLLYSHFSVLHRSFAFFFLHPTKVYSALTQILMIPLLLMEVSVVKNIYPPPKKGAGERGLLKNNSQSMAFPNMSST